MDILHKALKFASYNRGLVAAAAAVGTSLGVASCASKTIDPETNQAITREQLMVSVERLQSDYDAGLVALKVEHDKAAAAFAKGFEGKVRRYELAEADLDAKDEHKERMFSLVSNITGSLGAANPAIGGILTIAGPLLAGGLGLDNWRKGKRIRKLSTSSPAPKA